jgi:hypothetical protein
MSLLRYEDFLTESQIAELLLESKVVFSKKLINILFKMKGNRIADQLINLVSKDVPVVQNYIDVTDTKDFVSFTPDRKAQDLLKDKPQVWRVIESGRYLTNSNKNDKIFRALGYDKEKYGCWSPDTDTLGIILSETISNVSGNVYVMFQELESTEPRIGVINKVAVEESESSEFPKIWQTSRNPIAIGRLTRSLLTAAGVKFTDKELEEFTNLYKSTWDFMQDVLKQFAIVNGGDISYWYDQNHYVKGGGTLNNSCMANVDSEYFDLYTKNSNVSMVILYSDEGTISEKEYTSDKIKGRALLWKATVGGKGEITFMDRIYTRFDSDVELFKEFAKKNGWWWKTKQTMEPDESITNGSEIKSDPSIKVQMDSDCDYSSYPYLDTMCYLNEGNNCLYNYPNGQGKQFRETGGGFEEYSED